MEQDVDTLTTETTSSFHGLTRGARWTYAFKEDDRTILGLTVQNTVPRDYQRCLSPVPADAAPVAFLSWVLGIYASGPTRNLPTDSAGRRRIILVPDLADAVTRVLAAADRNPLLLGRCMPNEPTINAADTKRIQGLLIDPAMSGSAAPDRATVSTSFQIMERFVAGRYDLRRIRNGWRIDVRFGANPSLRAPLVLSANRRR